MISQESWLSIAEVDATYVNVPERCMNCPRLGDVAVRLTDAQANYNWHTVATEPEMMRAYARANLIKRACQQSPDFDLEQIGAAVETAMTGFEDTNNYARLIEKANKSKDIAGAKISTHLAEVDDLLRSCPTEGCESSVQDTTP